MMATASKPRTSGSDPRLLLASIFVSSLAVRVLAIQRPISIDEQKWMDRGLNFMLSVLDLDLANTYLHHHPGVTNMWVNGTGALTHCLLRHWLPSSFHLDQGSFQDCTEILLNQPVPLESYVIARLIQAMITSACLVYLFTQVRHLLGQSVALLGIGLLTVEPFFLAYQRLVVTDGLQVVFMTLATIMLLRYLRGDGGHRLLVGSGIWMGLAIATKILALALLPAIALWLVLIELGVWRSRFPQRGYRCQVNDIAVWGIALLGTILVIWPALWAAPGLTITQLLEGVQAETGRGEFFFLGQQTDAPGIAFYPVVMLYRTSPVVLIGAFLGLMALLFPQWRRHLNAVPELTALTLVSVSILLVLSSSSNKIDRYSLPALPPLVFLAAAGWLQSVHWVRKAIARRQHRQPGQLDRTSQHAGLTAAGLVLIQSILLIPHYPYYLTYFNPLLGGATAAERLLMLGSGEGLDQAAHWLNQSVNARTMTVGSWYSVAFAPYFHGKTLDISKTLQENRQWLQDANRLVFYVNQLQRHLPSADVLTYFTAQRPLYTVRLQGVDYVQVYPGPIARPEEIATLPVQQDVTFSGTARLRGYELTQPVVAGQPLLCTLYWEILQTPPPDTRVSLQVQGSDRHPWAASLSPPLHGYLLPKHMTPGLIIRDIHQLPLPTTVPSGTYTLEVKWFSNRQQRTQARQHPSRHPDPTPIAIGEFQVD